MSNSTLVSGADAPSSSVSASALAVQADTLQVFSGIAAFDAAQRMAKALCSSTLVPKDYQGQQGLANSLIALEIAGRMRLSPLVVMQNMTPIHGRPTWSSKFLIATVNASGRFSPLRFVFDAKEQPTSCYAVATDKATGEVLEGETITLELARKEGWWSRKDRQGNETSKWQTMTGQMLRYRAAAWWSNVYCPEIALGLLTQEEAVDIEAVTVRETSDGIQPAAALPSVAPAGGDGKRDLAVPALLRPREDDHPQMGLLNDAPDMAPISGGSAAQAVTEPAAQPAAVEEAVEAEVIDIAGSEPAAAAPATPRRSRSQAKAAASTAEAAGGGEELTQAAAQELAKTAPTPASQEADPVAAGLQQIPRIATLLELDAAYGRVNQLLGSGRISDHNAERLWSAITRRRSQLEEAAQSADPMAEAREVGP
ncbi:recombinase RecT [Cyanobium sp. A2C-AMD]|uniref:recombinase RecT n=1 Tax=Cyanobium sp. A2C-AMD TaxID=2823695 RepID=UPI0020CF343B|nr:recombinase RecT [Cyanobium sp. A2C-AMD]MCP9878205.1 recombinase RecT [Cyanobium sp. A2C-AMD]